MISYLSSIVTMSLYCTLSEILSVIRPLKGQFVIPLLKHHIANQCTKFQVSSFSRSADILGGNKNFNGSCDHNHAPFRDDLLSVC